MPNLKSGWKRMRQSQKGRARNRAEKSTLRTLAARLAATPPAEKQTREQTFREYCSLLDKAVKKGVIASNTANRRKSRAARELASAP
jgi:small subunit ribosomal protein S20